METNSSGDELLKTSSKETNCLETKSRGTNYTLYKLYNVHCAECAVYTVQCILYIFKLCNIFEQMPQVKRFVKLRFNKSLMYNVKYILFLFYNPFRSIYY